ncbi:choice-of-anchor tandem repeat GloVer-containing protein [Ideonella sp. BN130291]|uniref:choice-of-anchor tandem repeat GloVer-containing protein n=1 Tax=Ideonella sp. BN130291 TaxID=3112940 RepID=UPI002E26CBEC|nr:choice-of-anchor tandem repeat GloVer-containing protein [Ideonella sp. BN130291]
MKVKGWVRLCAWTLAACCSIPASASQSEGMSSSYEFTVLHHFSGNDGSCPKGPLTQAPDGSWYGVTGAGGARNAGTIFRISGDTPLQSLYSFTGFKDSSQPNGALVLARDGYLYGSTYGDAGADRGSIFRVSKQGELQTLYRMTQGSGAGPIIHGRDGSIYGTMAMGGPTQFGLLYRWTPGQEMTVLHGFSTNGTGTDGSNPMGHIVQGSDGSLYGATYLGGTGGHGTVYRVTVDGQFSLMHSFDPLTKDGVQPMDGLSRVGDTLFGTTVYGGLENKGTVFRVTPDEGYQTITRLPADNSAGSWVNAGHAIDSNVVVGTSSAGGANGAGTVFVAAGRMVTALASFPAAPFGTASSRLAVGRDGDLMGVTCNSGAYGLGMVYRLRRSVAH